MTNSVAAAPSADHGGAPPLPHPNRRPRVKQVASRFMSPAPSPISSAGDLHSLTMKSPKHSVTTPAPDRVSKPSPSQRRLLLRSQTPEPFSSSSQENIPETVRSMETPFQFAKPESNQRRQRAVVKLFKENGFGDQIQIPKSSTVRTSKSSRPDTPSDRIVPSRFRLPQQRQSNQSNSSSSSVTDAAKLLQLTGLSFSSANNESQSQSECDSVQGGSCPNSPIACRRTTTLPSDTSVSVTDENTSSTRSLVRSSSGSIVTGANSQTASSSLLSSSLSSSLSTPSLCSRSLNLPNSACLNTFQSIERSLCRPPQPASSKLGVESKKGKKPQSSQQDVYSLKLLHNHYLQWRFANAKAQVSMNAQTTQMESQLFSLGADISHLRDNVKKKQAELQLLQRTKALSTVLDTQMPYLDDWSAVEEDYTRSLDGAITALTNSLLRLPISGNVQVNVKDVAEALDSAVKTADMIAHQMQMFLPKAEEMDSLMSELATVIDVEKALAEECGNLLVKTHTLQIEDCSLRGHLMQVASS
ncbi:putative QWRF family protein [Helianthus annuus]|uniref:QWRF family protein n=1 Tax=Helianthus annuus TaxID=4232 RepID=A0A251S129_HELAN|nr:protein ENDOSPERM DEFECTIVE 1 [Helianthus annuus]KAF5760403.1 putative QWRF family protein [Helianthus annuus]KAJ0438462.1 putative QWRF family protein [Helianthus annuus]KAJ0443217.1 putative QWRF family protein [Helianthus annuus]KAJ0460785.1 putative QWRF family protein [Helianthus annuus]KAJ0645115.1 putative QWRF family protein [Helianthus annuus]